jgi:hypothetical protein
MRAAPPLLHSLASLAVGASSSVLALALALAACDDTPRGEQGIDFLIDGAYYTVPPGPEASADVLIPCVEEKDSAGLCAAAVSASGTSAPHLVVCTAGQAPLDIVCVGPADAGDASTADAGAFCCTTGVL